MVVLNKWLNSRFPLRSEAEFSVSNHRVDSLVSLQPVSKAAINHRIVRCVRGQRLAGIVHLLVIEVLSSLILPSVIPLRSFSIAVGVLFQHRLIVLSVDDIDDR